MTNPHRSVLITLLKLADLAVVAAAFALAFALASSEQGDWLKVFEMRVKVVNVFFIAGYLVYWHMVLRSFGLYRSYRLAPSSREWRDLAMAALVAAVPLWALGNPLSFAYATPTFHLIFTALSLTALGTERRLFRLLARSMRRHGHNLRNAIIVGDGDDALDMASRLARRADLGYQIIELIEWHEGTTETAVLDRIAQLLNTQPIDEVFVTLPLDTSQPLIRKIVALCEEQGTTVRVLSSVVNLLLARAQVDEVDGFPLITIFTGPPDSLRLFAKRVLDFTVSLLAIILLAPAFVAIALAIKLDSRGPLLFVQERVGLNGRRFRFFKFRTMVENAEALQASLESLNEADGPVFKIKNDPRVTRLGASLRRLSLDELPQLVNVLKGDMSLVGPRPLPLRDVSLIDTRSHKRRFSVKPGITCLWQIAGRRPEFDRWIKTDMEYIDNWSLGLDVKILLRTIPAVLSGRDAY